MDTTTQRFGQPQPFAVHNAGGVDPLLPFIYLIAVRPAPDQSLRYVGRARSSRRIDEYQRNLGRIARGVARPGQQNYRTVHLALWRALESGWPRACILLENPGVDSMNKHERAWREYFRCNLNGGRSWTIDERDRLTLADLGCWVDLEYFPVPPGVAQGPWLEFFGQGHG